MKKVDFLIVGQGIAGTVISHQLLNQGFSVCVVDKIKDNSASRIAAGVYNPVAYRKLKRAEFVEFLLPYMNEYYQLLEKELNTPFFNPMSFLKLLTDIEELNNWQIQCGNETNAPYMSSDIFKDDFHTGILNPYGAGQVLQSGIVKLPVLLDTWKAILKEKEALIDEVFDYDKLKISETSIQYKELEASKVIFSEGVGVIHNPWFNWLPIQRFKGEVLEIYAPKLQLDRMVNRGVFLLPKGMGYFTVGATHDWKNVDEIPTETGKQELLEKLNKIINVDFEVTDHIAGFRPSARDRHPYIGVHPNDDRLFVFNGLGSKGVIMVPWLTNQFISGMENLTWPKEFDIKRYIRFFNESQQNDKKN